MSAGRSAHGRLSAREMIEAMSRRNPVFHLLGIEVLEAEYGRTRLAMTVRKDLANTFDTLHGGILFALADTTFGMTCNARNDRGVTAGATIEMLASPKIGERVVAEAREVYRKGRNVLIDVSLWIDHGADHAPTICAHVRGRMRLVGGKVIEDAA